MIGGTGGREVRAVGALRGGGVRVSLMRDVSVVRE